MCGISGWFSSNKSYHISLLKKMCSHIKHRGPNAEGYVVFLNGNLSEYGNVALGHTRLSIIDLSANGNQPMCDKSKQYWIVYNGEIYNFLEIKQNLLKNFNIEFKSSTDTEVLLYLYMKYKEKCLDFIDGMYAFAIYDSLENKIFMARDRVGKKPLYYYYNNKEIFFGSEFKAVAECLNNSFTLNRESVYEFFSKGYIGKGNTIAQDIYQLKPGHWLCIDLSGNFKIKKYWDINEDLILKNHLPEVDEDAIINQTHELLKGAVKKRLISDVPLGVFLSGGIDSSLVAAIATKVSDGPISTFTVGFRDKKFDESGYARQISKALKTNHNEIILDENDFLSTLDIFFKVYDEPFADESAIPTICLSKFAKEKITVALSGDGGDEQFYGYTTYDYLSKLYCVYKIPYMIRKSIFYLLYKFSPNFDISSKIRSLFYKNFEECKNNLANPIDCISGLTNINIVKSEFTNKNYILDNKNSWMLDDIKNYMVNDVLVKVDRASMHFGLEVRNPLLGYDIVENSFYKIPIQLKVKKQKKYILKKILCKYLDPVFFERPKKGFSVPIKKWINGNIKNQIWQILNEKTILNLLLNVDKLKSLYNNFNFMNTKYGSKLFWRIFVFYKWERNNNFKLQ
jgi:asparagine synthase (glutamine-hydrolysing)